MAYLLKQKGFTDVTILEKSNRVGGMIEYVDLRGTRMTYHLWNDRNYQKTLIPLLNKFGFAPDFVNVTRADTWFWPTNDANVRRDNPHFVDRDFNGENASHFQFLQKTIHT